MINLIKSVTAPLARRISLITSKCILNIINDKTATQNAQAEFFTDEVFDDAEVWQNFGFTSVPPKGSEGIALFVGGERINPLIISTECKGKRLNNLNEGDAAVYSSAGNYIKVNADNSINIKSNKILIKNDQNELIDLISQICELLSQSTTNTMMGAQPLLNAKKFAELKTKIDSFNKD
ncbi:MAG: phage baseplate assembly protein [Silvanigrellaceae bacterium]|nr:phage baseplate assembly protein [Silvanigrellaceae bacterium]